MKMILADFDNGDPLPVLCKCGKSVWPSGYGMPRLDGTVIDCSARSELQSNCPECEPYWITPVKCECGLLVEK